MSCLCITLSIDGWRLWNRSIYRQLMVTATYPGQPIMLIDNQHKIIISTSITAMLHLFHEDSKSVAMICTPWI